MNQTYIVKKGDTLYGISNQFGVSVNDLIKINNLDNNTIQINQLLKIPNEPGNNPNNIIMYKVEKGDSLYSIANKYNTTVNEIIKLNDLTSNILTINQLIKIPEKYNDNDINLTNFKNYIVKKGDTLYSIAKNNNITTDILIKDNSLNNNNLQVGQILKIRITYSDDSSDYEECFGYDYNSSNNTTNYIVKKGDSLYSIANKYNTTVSELMKLNNLNSISLSIGQILKIPSNNELVYIVKKGDSLYQIAKKYNTSVDNIKKKNNLTNNNLAIGETLII